MKLNNCILCCTHKDNKENPCNRGSRHKFTITEKQDLKYRRDLDYINKEVLDGRHVVAALGSAGYTFISDIDCLANFAYAIDLPYFYELVRNR